MIEKCRKALEQDPYNSGLALKKAGDYAEALRLFMLAAEAGSAKAAFFVSVMYQEGEGVEKDEEESFRWEEKAAELGYLDNFISVAYSYYLGSRGAEKNLGKALFWAKKAEQARDENILFDMLDGDGLIRQIERDIAYDAARAALKTGDCDEAIRQFMRAAELGSADAAHNLAVMYETGDGVEKDEKEAFRWRVKAAELGRPDDMYVVALGYGDNQDFTQALFWAKKAKQAQEEGKLDKQIDVDGLIRKIEQDIAFDAATVARRSGDYAEAIRQFTRTAELGSAAAAHNLAAMYNTGKGVPKDEKESFRWSVKAAELGNPDDMFVVAYSCFYGKYGAERDLKQALLWAKKAKQAQENGKLNNQFNIDKLIREIEQEIAFKAGNNASENGDYAEALKQYTRAVELSADAESNSVLAIGGAMAAHNISSLYYNGNGVALDKKEGFRWNLKAAELGLPGAMFSVGWQYYNGKEIEKDLAKALFWAKKAKQTYEEGLFDKDMPVDDLIKLIEKDMR